MTADRNARIEQRAYHLWLEEGRPHGRHEEHWHRAKRELIEEERGLRKASPATAARDCAEVIEALDESVEKGPLLCSGSRQDPVAADPTKVTRSRAKSEDPEQAKTKPRARSSRPAAAGSGSRSSRRSAAAKPTV